MTFKNKNNIFIALLAVLLSSGLILFLPVPLVCFALLLVSFFFIFVSNSKSVIYFLLFAFPLIPLLSEYTTLKLGGAYASVNLGGLINIGTILLAMLVFFMRAGKILQDKLALAIIILLGVLGVSALFSPLRMLGIRQWIRLAMPPMCYFIILRSFDDLSELKPLLKFALLGSFFLPFSFGLWQLLSGNTPFVVNGMQRIYGTLMHPNRYAMFLVTLILLSGYFLLDTKESGRSWFYLLLLAGFIVSLFFTFARVGWASLLVAGAVLFFLRGRRFAWLIPSALAIAVLCFPLVKDSLAERLRPDVSFYQRFDLNAFGLAMFKERPLFGFGIGSYTLLSQSEFGTTAQEYGVKQGESAHNDYVRFLAEEGVVGLMSYLFLMFCALRLALQVFRLDDAQAKNYGAFLIAFITAMLTFGLTDHGLEYAGFHLFVFLAIGELMLRNSLVQRTTNYEQ